MNPQKIKLLTIFFSLSIFIISLTQSAFKAEFNNSNHMESLHCFLMGSIAFLGGGLLEEIIWMANPIALLSIFLLLKGNKNALTFAFIAFVIALSFSLWKKVLKSESGSQMQIISLEEGYYLWILSIAILLIGNILYFQKIKFPDKINIA
ncbi:hypothetical protein HYN48_13390 [Flavobacterium magnum]|uniref:Uncharacterized protein n=1 Tax=Flavobacterium magnum TaxID=2162713 RepID=A0A2S0RH51_9FLAO|nr:hypothetical protein [Flavobacterium magnum]AWA30994.1 hypothetical protein HYN48_13390 [Flavobacterium magnum]